MSGIFRAVVIALAVLTLAGCATRIDWKARVGIYTYDQAVTDYGPPDKFARLSDGTSVAEWMTQRGAVVATPGPYYYGPGYFGPVGPAYTTSYFPARFLRLTFSKDGKLTAWKEYSK